MMNRIQDFCGRPKTTMMVSTTAMATRRCDLRSVVLRCKGVEENEEFLDILECETALIVADVDV